MDIFNALNKNWTLESGLENLEGLDKSESPLRFELYQQIRNSNFEKCDIDIDKRIGMESTMAEVYKVDINKNLFMAAKILPISSKDSYINNKREFEFAIEASNLVLSGQSRYFLLVYDITFCKETHFHGVKSTSIKFREKSLRFQQFEQLLNSTNSEFIKSQIIQYKRKFMNPDYVRDLLKLENVKLSSKISSHILFSELACFDLDYYLSHYKLTEKDLYELLRHIFLGIQDMQLKLNLIHLDLHLGNIVLIQENNEYIPIIHDFGKSRKMNVKSDYDLQHDLFYFISKFEEKIRNLNLFTETILRGLDECIDVYQSSKNEFPIVSVVEFWNSVKI